MSERIPPPPGANPRVLEYIPGPVHRALMEDARLSSITAVHNVQQFSHPVPLLAMLAGIYSTGVETGLALARQAPEVADALEHDLARGYEYAGWTEKRAAEREEGLALYRAAMKEEHRG